MSNNSVFSDIFTSAAYDEDEIKSDAPSTVYLDKVWNYILHDPFYQGANNNHVSPSQFDDVDWSSINSGNVGASKSTSKYRYRY